LPDHKVATGNRRDVKEGELQSASKGGHALPLSNKGGTKRQGTLPPAARARHASSLATATQSLDSGWQRSDPTLQKDVTPPEHETISQEGATHSSGKTATGDDSGQSSGSATDNTFLLPFPAVMPGEETAISPASQPAQPAMQTMAPESHTEAAPWVQQPLTKGSMKAAPGAKQSPTLDPVPSESVTLTGDLAIVAKFDDRDSTHGEFTFHDSQVDGQTDADGSFGKIDKNIEIFQNIPDYIDNTTIFRPGSDVLSATRSSDSAGGQSYREDATPDEASGVSSLSLQQISDNSMHLEVLIPHLQATAMHVQIDVSDDGNANVRIDATDPSLIHEIRSDQDQIESFINSGQPPNQAMQVTIDVGRLDPASAGTDFFGGQQNSEHQEGRHRSGDGGNASKVASIGDRGVVSNATLASPARGRRWDIQTLNITA